MEQFVTFRTRTYKSNYNEKIFKVLSHLKRGLLIYFLTKMSNTVIRYASIKSTGISTLSIKSAPELTKKLNRQISQMMCQTRSVDKMAEFETSTLCISLKSIQIMCTYVCKDLVTGHCLYLAQNLIPTVICFQIVPGNLIMKEIHTFSEYETEEEWGALFTVHPRTDKLT